MGSHPSAFECGLGMGRVSSDGTVCCGLSCVPSKIQMLKPLHLARQDVTELGKKVFKELIKMRSLG